LKLENFAGAQILENRLAEALAGSHATKVRKNAARRMQKAEA
jgi:hypothetical protein